MTPLILIAVAVLVVVVVVVVVRLARSRSERSDWLGELSEIRRDSLGADEEVTGVVEAVSIVSSADEHTATDDAGSPESAEDHDLAERSRSDESTVAPDAVLESAPAASDDAKDPATAAPDDVGSLEPPERSGTSPSTSSVTQTPTRTVTDAGTLFNEYEWAGFGLIRIEATDPSGLRVIVEADATVRSDSPDFSPSQVMMDLPRGVAWLRMSTAASMETCTLRTPAGWVASNGETLVVVSEDERTYVMCLDGETTLRPFEGGRARRMTRGDVGRIAPDQHEPEVVAVGVDALESEGMIRRQRRLDASAGSERVVSR